MASEDVDEDDYMSDKFLENWFVQLTSKSAVIFLLGSFSKDFDIKFFKKHKNE